MSTAISTELPLPMPAGSAAATRHGGVDVLRMAAVIPVVFYHAGVLNQTIALVGMHALIAAAVVFAANGRNSGSAGQIISKRASRLLWPWLFFGLLHLFFAARSHALKPWMFIIGGSMHLWFVPFIFIVTCSVALARRSGGLEKTWTGVISWALLALGLILIEVLYTPFWIDRIPLWQFVDGATAVLVVLAAYAVPESAGRAAPLRVAIVISLLSLPLWLPFRQPGMMWVSPAGWGVVLFLAVSLLPAWSNRVTDFLGRTSFGLYLLHPLMLRIIELRVARLRHVDPEGLSHSLVIGCVVATIIACLLTIAAAERTPLRKFVV